MRRPRLKVLANTSLGADTRVVYTSDHGDSLGTRGLWGKSNMYQESAGIPMIMAGLDVPRGVVCITPVSLLDAFPTIVACVGLAPNAADADLPGWPTTHGTVRNSFLTSSATAGGIPRAGLCPDPPGAKPLDLILEEKLKIPMG